MTANHLHAYAKFQDDSITYGRRAEVRLGERSFCTSPDANGAPRGDPPADDEDCVEVLEARGGPPAGEEVTDFLVCCHIWVTRQTSKVIDTPTPLLGQGWVPVTMSTASSSRSSQLMPAKMKRPTTFHQVSR